MDNKFPQYVFSFVWNNKDLTWWDECFEHSAQEIEETDHVFVYCWVHLGNGLYGNSKLGEVVELEDVLILGHPDPSVCREASASELVVLLLHKLPQDIEKKLKDWNDK